ncbi:hypothetical protein EJ08DRAFT_663912 [Tothia fuscella]|uniref:Uncharacterized protein n=1 Tax=Tothia fuscella TaxID=1048955 RepID=A0A9P4TUA7_9PEZI|nr:hypothetical protein EJ08DRAFT_663912 [Tothia fuscella]
MAPFSYQKAKDILSEKELERVAVVFFVCAENIKPTAADFALAASEIGENPIPKPESFARMFRESLKKLREKEAYIDGAETSATANETGDQDEGGKADKPKTPRKRKAAAASVKTEGEDTPTPKKARSPKKKSVVKVEVRDVAQTVEGEDADVAAEGDIKNEAGEVEI